jgi:hypothetical protein
MRRGGSFGAASSAGRTRLRSSPGGGKVYVEIACEYTLMLYDASGCRDAYESTQAVVDFVEKRVDLRSVNPETPIAISLRLDPVRFSSFCFP